MTWNSKCPHMDNVVQLSLAELCKLKQGVPCSDCDACGPNLWICLDKNCLYTGCSEQYNDHSTKHFKLFQAHSIHMNLSSQRIWCYLCQQEVFLASSQRRTSAESTESVRHEKMLVYDRESCGESSAEDEDVAERRQEITGYRRQFGGLVGLQNIANTCYMNAALQALSNTPPLKGYFLDCGAIADFVSEQATPAQQTRKPGLAKSFHRLINEIWRRSYMSSGYVVPSGILHGIRSVHPMFRGFQQHDTQEFLRCFMDQLHEELKEFTPSPPDASHETGDAEEEDGDDAESSCSTPSSEAEYETCDSGVSEQSASDDGESEQMQRRRRYVAASPQPRRMKSVPQAKNAPRRSIISDVFDGKLLSSVQCLTCDRVSTREETFQDLSLPIPGKDHLTVLHQTQQMMAPVGLGSGITCTDAVYQAGQDGWLWWLWSWLRSWFWGPAVTLHDCMAAFFSADELKNDNMYSCEKCNKLRNGIKYSRVLALPEMLCVHLKRFRHDLSYSSKISSPVHFPLHGLDMRPYLHRNCQSEVSTYDLTAVICHHGTVGGGHYTSFARHDPSGKWFEFDDQLVTQVTPDVVQNCEAYVLFYRKSNHHMAPLRAQAYELEHTSPSQPSMDFYVSRQWLNRFNTFAEPGPIDNWALLCPHGGVPPGKKALVFKLMKPLAQPVWDFYYEKFGGGPACNGLHECASCRLAAESLSKRQKAELVAFMAYNDEFQLLETPGTIYAISMAWFRQWQLFARGVTTEEPGPINNTSIAQPSETLPIRSVKPGSDYAQINVKLWRFFHGIYGGGPEIVLRGNPQDDVKTQRIEKEESEEMDTEESPEMVPEESPLETDVGEKEVISPAPSEVETNGQKDVDSVESPPSALRSESTMGGGEKRIPKNVSFEDVETITNGSSEKESSAKDDATEGRSYSSRKKLRQETERGKREDKFRKSMKKTAGLFGPEGKFVKIIPDAETNNSHEQNCAPEATPKINGVSSEEGSGDISPLLHSSPSPPASEVAANNGQKHKSGDYGHHKSHHRRKRIN